VSRPTCPERTRLLVLRRAGHRCERCGIVKKPLDMSHRKAKGMGGTRLDQSNPALFNALCRYCHQWVERNPFEARRYGFKVAIGGALETTPVRRWNGWFTLDSSGSAATYECSDDGGP
jgi:hypothetical protein